MIKLVASDIDGTLVPDSKENIDQELYDVLMALKDRGVNIALASGRQKESIVHVFKPIQEKIFYIAGNGTYLGTYGRDLYTYTIDPDRVRTLIREAMELDPSMDRIINYVGLSYTDSKSDYFIRLMRDSYHYNLKVVDHLLDSLPEEGALTVSFHRDKIGEVAGGMMEKWKDKMQVTYSGLVWMDFLKKGANKGAAIKELQDSLEITPEETMVFGDQQNDVEMMKQAYYSYAVANAVPIAKQAARFQTDSNVNGGVLKVLKALLAGEIGELPR